MREALKPVEWVGDSLKRIRAFAKPIRQQAGYELELVQHDMEPSDWKPMAAVGHGVNEIRIHIDGERRPFVHREAAARDLCAACFPEKG